MITNNKKEITFDYMQSCKDCNDILYIRFIYNQTTNIQYKTYFCYSCENNNLQRLGRSVGK